VRKEQLPALALGDRLRILRVKAMLTQAEVAVRMGLTGRASGRFIEHLENGRTKNPSVKTIALFLRACGARWHQVTDLLEYAEPVEIDTKPIDDSEFDFRDKQRLEQAVEKQVRKYEVKLASPVGSRPEHPARQPETVRRLRNYRIVANIVEQEVAELLADRPVVSIEYPRYKAVAREVVGLLWREVRRSQKSKVKSQNRPEDGECRMQNAECRMQNEELAERLAEKAEYWGTQKLDAELVRKVQDVVIRRFAALQETNPELFPHA
jgi:transcriptional regulator with XRE-family HTH domain